MRSNMLCKKSKNTLLFKDITLDIIIVSFLILKTKDIAAVLLYILFIMPILLVRYRKWIASKNCDDITGAYQLDYILSLGEDFISKGDAILVLLLDIDEFKQINYTFGHLTGNYVLYQLVSLLKKEVQALDGFVGRIGGDEFIILLRNITNIDLNKFYIKIDKLVKNACFKCDLDLPPIKVFCSIGMADNRNDSKITMQDLLQAADENMYYIKKIQSKSALRADISEVIPNELQRLMIVLKEKDMYSYVHSEYVMLYATKLAEGLGLPSEMIEDICVGAWIHDIGKLLIPNDILRKRGTLSEEEYNIIKKHIEDGLAIIQKLQLSETSINSLKYHHERYDGKGYPYGISGDNTPVEGKIMQIADAFSAMTIKRVYRELISPEAALREIQKNSGTQFDPYIAAEFIKLFPKSN